MVSYKLCDSHYSGLKNIRLPIKWISAYNFRLIQMRSDYQIDENFTADQRNLIFENIYQELKHELPSVFKRVSLMEVESQWRLLVKQYKEVSENVKKCHTWPYFLIMNDLANSLGGAQKFIENELSYNFITPTVPEHQAEVEKNKNIPMEIIPSTDSLALTQHVSDVSLMFTTLIKNVSKSNKCSPLEICKALKMLKRQKGKSKRKFSSTGTRQNSIPACSRSHVGSVRESNHNSNKRTNSITAKQKTHINETHPVRISSVDNIDVNLERCQLQLDIKIKRVDECEEMDFEMDVDLECEEVFHD
uniref:Myb/SANT-like DNA-binding domain-containing protein n=1 Tax=Trichogramma kaykai TaxID=54128 RepID=A0ABD2WJ83_9HYME